MYESRLPDLNLQSWILDVSNRAAIRFQNFQIMRPRSGISA